MTRPARQVDDQADVLADPAAHWPRRPGWLCDADDQDWPCEPLRQHLLATRTRSEIADEMGRYYASAMVELRLEERLVHNRFFAWARTAGWHPAGGVL